MSARFNIGDKVRYGQFASLAHGGGMVIGLSTTDYNGVLVAWKDLPENPIQVNAIHLEIVARAHYAPEGVPMVAMTPERIEALDDAADALDYQHLKRAADCDTPREDDVNIPGGCMCKEHEAAVRDMLAEARGEVKP